MALWKKSKKALDKADKPEPRKDLQENSMQWINQENLIKKPFPGPKGVIVPLRVAMKREVYAEVTAHSHESIDKEVCGVLIGNVCEDGEGLFLHVQHIIRGVSTKQGSAHVTFTQETWNEIHQELETKYTNMNIIGWYHSHPGFGVEFSEMDIFIQNNFFPAQTQVALVIDPLGGNIALCINDDDSIQYISKFWVDGKEQKAFIPESKQNGDGIKQIKSAPATEEKLQLIETRLSQVIQTLDGQQAAVNRALMTMGIIFALGMIFVIGLYIFNKVTAHESPPKLIQYIPIPVKIEGQEALIGIGIVGWELPPKATAFYRELQDEKLKGVEERLQKEMQNWAKENKEESRGWFGKIVDYIKGIFSKKRSNHPPE